MRRLFIMAALAVGLLTGCGGAIDQIIATSGSQPDVPQRPAAEAYLLGSGDKLRVLVFGEPDLSGEFAVDDRGQVDLPLIGQVEADGLPVRAFEERVVSRLKDGYLRDPRVSIQVLSYRPFFILGEVRSGGEYAYRTGLTVQDAVAMAGGYSYRANRGVAFIRHAGEDAERAYDLSQRVPILPGDNIRIPERFF